MIVTRLWRVAGDLVKERRLAEHLAQVTGELRHRSMHDPLTGLPNRALFSLQLDQAWAHHQRDGRDLVVLAIDLDGFKEVNDHHGHLVGDRVLAEVAARLGRCVRTTDTLARLGGDEFAVVLPETDLEEAGVIAGRVERELAAPFELSAGAHPLCHDLAASIGIAGVGDRHTMSHDLLREADIALYAAKAAGKGRHAFFAPGIERAAQVSLSGIEPCDARAWAAYMRELRRSIADCKLSGGMAPQTRAPEGVGRSFQRMLEAIDELDDAGPATMTFPARRELEEFVFHQTAVQHWADALVAEGAISVRRPPEADRFWRHLELALHDGDHAPGSVHSA